MSSLVLLPAWFAAFLLFRKVFADAREATLAACVAWGVVVCVLTEVLSIFHALAFLPLLVAWGVISIGSLSVVIRARNGRFAAPALTQDVGRLTNFGSLTLIGGTLAIFLATLVVALVAPPNNWDSMTYHMARVANWIDHRSIRHYPTHIIRQLYLGPWAESAITHLQILTRSDRLANLVQFVAMLGSAVGSSLVAKKLGAEQWGQLFAFVYCATIPIGILEASTTQNDYVTAFWFLCFINFALELLLAKSESVWSSGLAGASLGLAVLTKITSLIFATPFLAWLSYVLLRSRRARAIPVLALLAATVLTINAGHFIRNTRAWGSPLAPAAEVATYGNQIHTPAAISSNLIRNVAVHLAVPKIGSTINKGVLAIHSLTGLEISDPRITAQGETFRYTLNLNENSAGNPLHLLIGVFCIAVAFWFFPSNRIPAFYTSCLIAGFVLFCGYLRWQPWISRLHLPLFVAGAPLCGWAFSRQALRRVGYVSCIAVILIGLLYATRNDTRPLVGHSTVLAKSRLDLYFASRPELRQPFFDAADEVARGRPEIIGLVTGMDDWEYPFRILVRMRLGSRPMIEHVNVQNESRTCPPEIAEPGRLPDKIVLIGSPSNFIPPSGFAPTFTSKAIRVFAGRTTPFYRGQNGAREP